jgi:hypothetical protein
MLGLIAGSFGLPAAFVFAAVILLFVPVLGWLMLRREGEFTRESPRGL